MFLNEDMNPFVVSLPQGHDPDSFLRERGVILFEQVLSTSTDMLNFYLDSIRQQANSREEMLPLLRELLKTLAHVSSPVLRGECLKKISEHLLIPYELLAQEMSGYQGLEIFEEQLGLPPHVPPKDRELINLFLHGPETFREIDLTHLKDLCSSQVTYSILEKMRELFISNGELDCNILLSSCDEGEACHIRELILAPPIYKENNLKKVVESLKLKIMCNVISKQIQAAKDEFNLEALNVLIKQKAEIMDKLLQIS
jgi:DNA primase